jgi:hypothetical protein
VAICLRIGFNLSFTYLKKIIMRKKLLSGTFKKGLAFVFLTTLVAGFTLAQSPENRAKVLQKCIDLPGLQKYFQNANGSLPQQLYVMQHGVSFNTDIAVTWNGKPLVFMEKNEIISNNINAYFLFHTFEIAENSARVDFIYNFNDPAGQPKMARVQLDLQKAGVSWNIVQSKIEEN